jgi:hypothetical protein
MAHLSCSACGRRLTRDCRVGALEEFTVDAQDRAPSVQVGVMVRLEDMPDRPGVALAGCISTNPEDVIRSSVKHIGMQAGCCGLDGMDGPNVSCVCGAVVGTEWSDCWTQAELRFLPAAVSMSK